MSQVRIKMIVGGLVIAVAVTLLALAGVRDGWVYYLPVDEFVNGNDYHAQRVRLHGTVSADQIEVAPARLVARFDLLGETERIRIDYSGIVPDLFEADRDVVVEGQLGADGSTFEADTLLTKCASKYESAEGQAPHGDPNSAEVVQ